MRFPGGARRDPAVDAWLRAHRGELGGISRRWFDVMRACGDDVRELLHDGHPTACVGDAAFGYVNLFTAHVNVGFFQGSVLPDPYGLLEGTGKFMRHVKIRPGEAIDDDALAALIRAAYDRIPRAGQEFSFLPGRYALVQLDPRSPIPAWSQDADGFVSITRTDDELSIVCRQSSVPDDVKCDGGWACMKLKGPFAFDQVGILSSFAVPLAQAGVGIFAISTFDTDYILVKDVHRADATRALLAAGHVPA